MKARRYTIPDGVIERSSPADTDPETSSSFRCAFLVAFSSFSSSPFPSWSRFCFFGLVVLSARTGIASTGIGSLLSLLSLSLLFLAPLLYLQVGSVHYSRAFGVHNIVPLFAFPALFPLYDWFWYSDRPSRRVYSLFVPFGLLQLWGIFLLALLVVFGRSRWWTHSIF